MPMSPSSTIITSPFACERPAKSMPALHHPPELASAKPRPAG
jgi:hypothetical protein